MVKRRKKGITKKDTGKGFNERSQEARKMGLPRFMIGWRPTARRLPSQN